eukprot:g3813.t1
MDFSLPETPASDASMANPFLVASDDAAVGTPAALPISTGAALQGSLAGLSSTVASSMRRTSIRRSISNGETPIQRYGASPMPPAGAAAERSPRAMAMGAGARETPDGAPTLALGETTVSAPPNVPRSPSSLPAPPPNTAVIVSPPVISIGAPADTTRSADDVATGTGGTAAEGGAAADSVEALAEQVLAVMDDGGAGAKPHDGSGDADAVAPDRSSGDSGALLPTDAAPTPPPPPPKVSKDAIARARLMQQAADDAEKSLSAPAGRRVSSVSSLKDSLKGLTGGKGGKGGKIGSSMFRRKNSGGKAQAASELPGVLREEAEEAAEGAEGVVAEGGDGSGGRATGDARPGVVIAAGDGSSAADGGDAGAAACEPIEDQLSPRALSEPSASPRSAEAQHARRQQRFSLGVGMGGMGKRFQRQIQDLRGDVTVNSAIQDARAKARAKLSKLRSAVSETVESVGAAMEKRMEARRHSREPAPGCEPVVFQAVTAAAKRASAAAMGGADEDLPDSPSRAASPRARASSADSNADGALGCDEEEGAPDLDDVLRHPHMTAAFADWLQPIDQARLLFLCSSDEYRILTQQHQADNMAGATGQGGEGGGEGEGEGGGARGDEGLGDGGAWGEGGSDAVPAESPTGRRASRLAAKQLLMRHALKVVEKYLTGGVQYSADGCDITGGRGALLQPELVSKITLCASDVDAPPFDPELFADVEDDARANLARSFAHFEGTPQHTQMMRQHWRAGQAPLRPSLTKVLRSRRFTTAFFLHCFAVQERRTNTDPTRPPLAPDDAIRTEQWFDDARLRAFAPIAFWLEVEFEFKPAAAAAAAATTAAQQMGGDAHALRAALQYHVAAAAAAHGICAKYLCPAPAFRLYIDVDSSVERHAKLCGVVDTWRASLPRTPNGAGAAYEAGAASDAWCARVESVKSLLEDEQTLAIVELSEHRPALFASFVLSDLYHAYVAARGAERIRTKRARQRRQDAAQGGAAAAASERTVDDEAVDVGMPLEVLLSTSEVLGHMAALDRSPPSRGLAELAGEEAEAAGGDRITLMPAHGAAPLVSMACSFYLDTDGGVDAANFVLLPLPLRGHQAQATPPRVPKHLAAFLIPAAQAASDALVAKGATSTDELPQPRAFNIVVNDHEREGQLLYGVVAVQYTPVQVLASAGAEAEAMAETAVQSGAVAGEEGGDDAAAAHASTNLAGGAGAHAVAPVSYSPFGVCLLSEYPLVRTLRGYLTNYTVDEHAAADDGMSSGARMRARSRAVSRAMPVPGSRRNSLRATLEPNFVRRESQVQSERYDEEAAPAPAPAVGGGRRLSTTAEQWYADLFQEELEQLKDAEARVKEPRYSVFAPPASLPPVDFSCEPLFRCLGHENVIRRRVLLVSTQYTTLVEVGEALRALMHPLQWCLPYVPVLPRPMSDYLECPTPYLFGIGREWATGDVLPQPADDLTLVDLDHNYLRGNCVAPELPQQELRALRAALRACDSDPLRRADALDAFALDDHAQAAGGGVGGTVAPGAVFPEAQVREAFRATVSSLLTDVTLCSFRLSEPPSVSASGAQAASGVSEVVVFDEQTFLARHAARDHALVRGGSELPVEPFMRELVRSQSFSAFVGAGEGDSGSGAD